MPELPEVETIRQGLARHLPGRRIRRVEVRCPRLILRPDWEGFVLGLTAQSWLPPRRVGKFLVLDLQTSTLLVHLGMTGQLTFRDPSRPDSHGFTVHPVTGLQQALQHAPDKHTHIILHHEDGTALCYRDIRKFGKWRLYSRAEAASAPELAALGPDPLTDHFTLEALRDRLVATSRHIKCVLLDQGVVAGLGNIYVDETLHRCGIRPTRRAHRITAKETCRLFEEIPRLLREAIAHRGTTFSDYRDAEGNTGDNAVRLQVYGRHGQPCPSCGNVLRKSTVAGRTSSWCGTCQR